MMSTTFAKKITDIYQAEIVEWLRCMRTSVKKRWLSKETPDKYQVYTQNKKTNPFKLFKWISRSMRK